MKKYNWVLVINFAKEIIKNSKVKLFLVDDKFQLAKYIKNNIYGKKIVIGMGAGTISTWMRECQNFIMSMNRRIYLLEFNDNVKFDYDLKKKIGLILVVKLKFILKQKI